MVIIKASDGTTSITTSGQCYIAGNLSVGNSNIVNSTNTSIADTLIKLGQD